MPTLHWLIQESGLHNIRLMTGKSQLMHPIVSVNVLDNPDVIKWFKQDELILTTGFVFKNHPELVPRILRDLKSCGCTALGIKVPRFFRQIPPEMLAEAKALDFPLLELPFFYGFSEIMQRVYHQVYVEDTNRQQVSQNLLFQLMQAVLDRTPIEMLLLKAAKGLHYPLLLIDARHRPLTAAFPNGNEAAASELLASFTSTIPDLSPKASSLPDYLCEGNHRWGILPFPLPNRSGTLYVLHETGKTPSLPASFFEHLTQILAFSFEQDHITERSYENRSSVFLQFLMYHQDASEAEIRNLCTFYGFPHHCTYLCLTIALDHFPPGKKSEGLRMIKGLLPDFTPEPATTFICANENLFCCFFLFPVDYHRLQMIHEISTASDALAARLAHITTLPLNFGCSACHQGLMEIRTAFVESLQAMSLRKQLSPAAPNSYLSLIPVNLLMTSGNAPKLLQDHLLAPLITYDAQNHTALLATLDAYLQHGCNTSAAAKDLFLHRNTMIHRIEKIKELLQVDFTDETENLLLRLSLIAVRLHNH